MKKFYLLIILSLFLFVAPSARGYAVLVRDFLPAVDTSKTKIAQKETSKITDTRKNKPDFLKKGIKLIITPFKGKSDSKKASGDKGINNLPDDEKVISNVKVFPNPIENEINLSYKVNKDSNVTIKIMDVLGNEITTLLSQKLIAGDQNNKFTIATRLNSGFYFLRLMVGNEVVVKRISVL